MSELRAKGKNRFYSPVNRFYVNGCFSVMFLVMSHAFFGSASSMAGSAPEPVSVGLFKSNQAIGQHDTVSYFSSGKSAKGDAEFVHQWKGADWYFISQAQRDQFAANPNKYAPMYNGFCSNALILDEGLIRTSGKVWHIFEGNLHMFFAERGLNRWLSGDYAQLKAEADKAWQQELAVY